MPVGDLFEVTVVCQNPQQFGLNVSHWTIESISGATPSDQAHADRLDVVLAPLYKACLCDQSTYNGVRLQYIGPGAPRIAVIATAGAGQRFTEGEQLPSQVTGLFTLRTGFAGRGYRGRKYIPFPAENDNTEAGVPSGGYQTSVEALATAYIGDILVGTVPTSSVIHCYILRKETMERTKVTAFTFRTRWATQRRRSQINRGDLNPLG